MSDQKSNGHAENTSENGHVPGSGAQRPKSEQTPLASADGAPVGDNQNPLTAGERGPLLMQDVQLQEQMQHFDRERIPERHHTVITLSEESLKDGRNFGEWQMAFQHFGDVFPSERPEGDVYEGYSDFLNARFDDEAFTADPSYARSTLLHFKDTDF